MVKRPWSRWSDEDKAEAIRLYEAGQTVREIAEWLGRPMGSTWSVLTRAGVVMRPAGNRKPSEVTQ